MRPQLLRRSIFSFAASHRKPLEYSERKVLRYSPSQVYELVSDVGQYKAFVPYCVESRVLSSALTSTPNPVSVFPNTLSAAVSSPGSDGPVESAEFVSGQRKLVKAALTVGFGGITESYVSSVICERPSLVKASASNTSLFTELVTTWCFSPVTPGTVISNPSPIKGGNHLRPHTSPVSTSHSTIKRDSQQIMSSTMIPPPSEQLCHTLIDFHIRFQFRNPLHASVAYFFFEQISKSMVKAFEVRAREVYGHDRRITTTTTTNNIASDNH